MFYCMANPKPFEDVPLMTPPAHPLSVLLIFFGIPITLAFWIIVLVNYKIYREQKRETQKQYDEWITGLRP